MGYVGWIDTFEGHKNTGKLGKVNSLLVDELYSLGAVFYCKTSLPQTLLVRFSRFSPPLLLDLPADQLR